MARQLCKVACLVALLVAASSCRSSQSEFLTASDEAKERSSEIQSLSWPPGAPLPSFAPTPTEIAGKRVTFQVGFGRSEADQAWFCAWSKDWLDNRMSDIDRADRALSELDNIDKLTIWGDLGGGQHSMADAIAKAKLGDPEPIQSWREMFCCAN
jgi:hypothetical protein